MKEGVDVEDRVGNLAFGHKTSLIWMYEGAFKVDVLESLGKDC